MKPWREIAVPHPDVLAGTFNQSEFAADITAVRKGKAVAEYGDAQAFFQRTYITEGMGLLLKQVAERLNGKGGEPVIQLQTAFGGGKTHTLLAVYHMATRKGSLQDLAGIPDLLDKAGLMDVPRAKVAVLDGTDLAPGQPRIYGSHEVRTLWGELAWQLGGEEAFAMVAESDAQGTSPGKELIRTLLEKYAPCVILLDELVVYMRQFNDGQRISGGTFDSNLSFLQSLTEAVKQVPNAVLLASLPESNNQAGGQAGIAALRALEELFNRVQAIWKAVAKEESFEIVRRRLFEPLKDEKERTKVCRAFADAYVAEGSALPGETQEGRYFDALQRAYPIHPEVFDRLYEDWTTIPGFQRTRGVLKLMAKVIHRLWIDNNTDLLIMPGSVPLYDAGGCRAELIYHLAPGWDPVVDRDIDSTDAETTSLENQEARFGSVQAARRVARTIFMGTAPASVVATGQGARGIDRARVLLGCLQPGQSSSVFSNALDRLADRLHYLNSSGDKAQPNTRFWFNTTANLRREMEDRKRRFNADTDIREKIQATLKRVLAGLTTFDGTHVFTPHSDVPDDSSLRLVALLPENAYAREEPRMAFNAVDDYLRNNGTRPRHRPNRLLFLAADHGSISRLSESVRTVLAWESIVDDIKRARLNLDLLQAKQAEQELQTASDVLPRVVRDSYKWLLSPDQPTPTEPNITVEPFQLGTSGSTISKEIERVTTENELVITMWSPIHLRDRLKSLYWKGERKHLRVVDFWEDSLKYLYLPRLRDRNVLSQAVQKGAAGRDFFATAYGQTGETYEGFKFGEANIQADDTLLLIEPDAAKAYEATHPATPPQPNPGGQSEPQPQPGGVGGSTPPAVPGTTPPHPATKAKAFHGSVAINAATSKVELIKVAEEIISLLGQDPNAEVKVTLEVSAEFSSGALDHVKRGVTENSKALGFRNADWE